MMTLCCSGVIICSSECASSCRMVCGFSTPEVPLYKKIALAIGPYWPAALLFSGCARTRSNNPSSSSGFQLYAASMTASTSALMLPSSYSVSAFAKNFCGESLRSLVMAMSSFRSLARSSSSDVSNWGTSLPRAIFRGMPVSFCRMRWYSLICSLRDSWRLRFSSAGSTAGSELMLNRKSFFSPKVTPLARSMLPI